MFKAAELSMLRTGWGKIKQDVALSRMWVEAAASKGHATAVMILRHQKRVDERKRMEEEAYYKLAAATAQRPGISEPTAEQLEGLAIAKKRAEIEEAAKAKLLEEFIMPTSESSKILDMPPPDFLRKKRATTASTNQTTSSGRPLGHPGAPPAGGGMIPSPNQANRATNGTRGSSSPQPQVTNVQRQIDAQREISRMIRERARQKEMDSSKTMEQKQRPGDDEVKGVAGSNKLRLSTQMNAEEFVKQSQEMRARAGREQELGKFTAMQQEMARMQESMMVGNGGGMDMGERGPSSGRGQGGMKAGMGVGRGNPSDGNR